MQKLREVIAASTVPSWVHSTRKNFGAAAAGTPKADDWRRVFTIYLPIALISLHAFDSPFFADATFGDIIEHTMQLVSAVSIACKRVTSERCMKEYLSYITAYISRLNVVFPGLDHNPIHHLAFHIHDFLKLFGPVHSWWCFPFERLIGLLQRIPTNHHFGASLG